MQQPFGHVRIDIAGRLIGDQQVGPVDHRAGDGDALLLPARQRRRARAGAVGKPDPVEHLAHRAFDVLLAGAGDAQRKRDIVERRQMADQAEILEHDPDAAAKLRQCIARRVAELFAEQADPAPRRPLRQIEQLEQRGFARARRAGEEIEAPAGQPELEVAQDLGARAKAQADAVEFGDFGQLLSFPKTRAADRRIDALPFLTHSCLP